MVRLVLLGPPGAGKGTQAEKLAKELKVPHISTGDILRQAVAAGTALGLKAKQVLEAGRLVSDEIMLEIIGDRLARPDCTRGYILDGYPRTLAQAKALDELLTEAGEPPVLVVNIEVKREELVRRIAGRRSCPGCGAVYNVHFQPPRQPGVCDVCGNALVQRSDDREETVRERLAIYERQTLPVLEHYAGRLTAVDGRGSSEQVFDRIAGLVRAAVGH